MTDIEEADMFCFQCEQTQGGKGCDTVKGVCGKTAAVAALQDLLIEVAKKVATYAYLGRHEGYSNKETDRWVLDALFSTLTNVNFDERRMDEYLRQGGQRLKMARESYFAECDKKKVVPRGVKHGDWEYKPNLQTLVEEGQLHVFPKQREDPDIASTKQLALFGIKGAAAYYHHAMRLNFEDGAIYELLQKILYDSTRDLSFEDSVKLALTTGELSYKVLELLDKANTQTYGHPVPTVVKKSHVKGKCVLVSGHDLRDLDLILKQTEGKGLNVYTHGEMLPCNAYPNLHAHRHLIGHYGGPWQKQKEDFQNFPGAIFMTTNCIIEPKKTYVQRIFTHSSVGFPGVVHVPDDNFAPVIEAALKEKGFPDDEAPAQLTIGFAHHTVLSLAGTIVEAVKKGAIKHFFVIGGCDGTESERSYYTDFAKAVPKDCIIITLGCGKYRINALEYGTIDFEGTKIPRFLDAGQCNDSYSAIQIALALAGAFHVGVNELPLSLVISWFEQKAVAVLLTLLHLGVKNIVIGPRLPAFVSPKLLSILVSQFGLRPISTVEADMQFLLTKTAHK